MENLKPDSQAIGAIKGVMLKHNLQPISGDYWFGQYERLESQSSFEKAFCLAEAIYLSQNKQSIPIVNE